MSLQLWYGCSVQGRDLVSCMYLTFFSLERKAGTFKNQNTGNTVNPSQTLGSHNPTALTHNNCHFYLSNIACHYFCVHYVLMSILHKNLGKWDWGGLTVSPVFWFLNVPAFFSRENTHRCHYVSRSSKGQPWARHSIFRYIENIQSMLHSSE